MNEKQPQQMNGRHVTAQQSEFNYDMKSAPVGGKLIVLNPGNVATFAILTSTNKKDFKAWAPLPKIRKDMK